MRALKVLLVVGYPFIAFAAISLLPAHSVALALTGALARRALTDRHRLSRDVTTQLLLLLGLGGAVLVVAVVFETVRLFLFVPALLNMALFVAFARTLHGGPSMIEVLARWQGYRIWGEKVDYCRKVTFVWCGFFLLNTGVILWLALYGTLAWWTLYTGVAGYVLVAALFTAEIVYRAWRFRDYRDTLVDRSLRAVFPPRQLGQ